jgi:integrator complex subunit 5
MPEIILEDLSRVLSTLVSFSPWAPIVSTWSMDCLGKLSTKWWWSSKICGKQGPNSTQLLHEKMPAWLGCSAARVLLDLAEDCLAKLMDSKLDTKMENTVDFMMSDTESCVAALLETSVKHNPHFDWVVAHIGSCFSHTITHRVLSVGLKDYITASKEGEGDMSLTKVTRLLSMVNILSHLATTHQTDLQTPVHSMLSSSLTTTPPSSTHTAAEPFLLSLSTLSPRVRRAFTSDLAPLIIPLLDMIPVL